MSTIACPHCSGSNVFGSTFCAACGKALPTGLPGSPRIVGKESFAASSAGVALQSEQLNAQTKKAFGALLAVAILQTLGAILITFALNTKRQESGAEINTGLVSIIMFSLAAVFFGLAFWARKNPFPAAIVGLVLFITVHLLDAIADPTTLIQGLLVKIIVIVVLIRAVSAGARYRKLVTQSQAV